MGGEWEDARGGEKRKGGEWKKKEKGRKRERKKTKGIGRKEEDEGNMDGRRKGGKKKKR